MHMKRLLALLALVFAGPVFADCTAPPDGYSRTVCTDSPSLYYRMHASSGTTETLFQGSSPNGSYTGAFSLSQTGIPGDVGGDTAVSFDASSSSTARMNLAVGGSSIAGPSATNGVGWSAEVWGKFVDFTDRGGGGGQSPLSRYGPSTFQWAFFVNPPDSKITAVIYANCNGTSGHTIAGSALSTATWYAFLLTTLGNGTNVATHLYLNGVDQGTFTQGTCANGSTTSDITAGSSADGGLRMRGTIDEVAIYTSEISSARALTHYNCGFAGTGCDLAPSKGRRFLQSKHEAEQIQPAIVFARDLPRVTMAPAFAIDGAEKRLLKAPSQYAAALRTVGESR